MAEADPVQSKVRKVAQLINAELSRRAFIGASGSALLVLPVAAEAQAADPIFEKRPDGAIRVVRGARNWTIDPRWFHYKPDPAATLGPSTALIFVSKTKIRISGLFAGTNLVADCQIEISKPDGVWSFVWTFGSKKQAIGVDQWFAGARLPQPIPFSPDSAYPDDVLRLNKKLQGSLSWPMALDLQPVGSASFEFTLSSANKGRAETLSLRPYDAAGNNGLYVPPSLTTDVANLLPSAATGTMRVMLGKPVLAKAADGWLICEVGDDTDLKLLPVLPQIIVEALWRSDAKAPAFVWRMSAAAQQARLMVGDAGRPRSLFLQGGSELIEYHGFDKKRFALTGGLADSPRLLQGHRFAAMVRGVPQSDPPILGDRDQKLENVALPVTLYALHARGEDGARYDIDYRTWQAAAPYLDRSSLLCANGWLDQSPSVDLGVEAVLTLGRRSGPAPTPNHLHLGTDSGASIKLHRPGAAGLADDSPILRVRRHQDALDLGFQFHDYGLEVRNDRSRLHPGPAARRAVRFHPQHTQEEAFITPAAAPPFLAGGLWLGVKGLAAAMFLGGGGAGATVTVRRLGEEAGYGEDGVVTKYARTRVAGPSRIAFQARAGAAPTDLSVSSLTDWAELKLAVSGRMAAAAKPLDEQLAALNIDLTTDRPVAQQRVNAQFEPPAGDQTALELVTGLVFSPDENARFRVPSPSTIGSGLWTAQLELVPLDAGKTPTAEVRALWANGLTSKNLIGGAQRNDPLASDPPIETSLTGREKGEIVLMSSGMGLAALRALSATGRDVPASLVRLPKGDFQYLDRTAKAHPKDPNGPKYRQEGVMNPAPFSRFAARLTGYGADLDAEWNGEPVAPHHGDPRGDFFNRAFTVERYVHRTSLGSDMVVNVLHKGFLFPYGFRVVLLKIVEREPQHIPGMGAMAPLIEHYFIVPKPVTKAMPGIYQPFGGLEIPMRHARLIGERSPEVDKDAMKVPPELAALIAASDPGQQIVGEVFWPKVKDLKTDIEFEFDADDTGTRRSVPMLFMDNAAVHDPRTVRAVIHYYNQIVGKALRTENHHGGHTIFGAPRDNGDTSFETDRIFLKARSRMVDDTAKVANPTQQTEPDLVQFQMDAFMEGADEPPFYPIMEEARIKVPPLDRLIGAPQGFKRVGYNRHYVRNGFDAKGNPSELYLNFLDADGLMQLGGRGEISGGVSQTPTPVAGLSRANAIVGAPARRIDSPGAKALAAAKSASAAEQRGSAMPPVGSDDQTPWDLSQSVANVFDPASFFKFPKILGCIDIGQAVLPTIMANQPKLKEAYDYSIGQGNETAAAITKAFAQTCGTAAEALWTALEVAEKRLTDFLAQAPAAPALLAAHDYPNLQRYYPTLSDDLKRLGQQFAEASTISQIGQIPAKARTIMNSWRQLRGAVDAVIANPAPEPVRDIVARIRSGLDLLQVSLRDALTVQLKAELAKLKTSLVAPIRDALLDQVFTAAGAFANPWLFEAWFGPVPAVIVETPTRAAVAGFIDGLLAKPEALPAGLVTAPLAQALLLPLLGTMAGADRLITQVGTVEMAMIGQAAELGFGALQTVIETVAAVQGLVDSAVAAAGAVCTAGTTPLMQMLSLALSGVPAIAALNATLARVDGEMKLLLLPDIGATPEAEAVRQAAAALRVPIQRLAAQVRPIETLIHSIPTTANDQLNWCTLAGRVPAAIAELQRQRDLAVAALEDIAVQAARVSAAVLALADADRKAADAALAAIRADFGLLARDFTLALLADAPTDAATRLYAALQIWPAPVVARLAAIRDEVLIQGRALKEQCAVVVIDDALLGQIVTAAAALARVERRLLAFATDFSSLPGAVLTRVQALAKGLASGIGDPLIDLHDAVGAAATTTVQLIEAAPDIVALLTGPLLGRLKKARDAVATDRAELAQVVSDPVNAAALLARWRREEPGLALAARTLLELFDAIARGQIGALFDLSAARRAIEDAVRHLIPSRVSVTYDWDADLTPFPAGNPVFLPGVDENEATATPDFPGKDLKISTRIEIDLLDPKNGRSIEVVGRLQPFTLKLLGSNELCLIHFTKTEFRSNGSGSPKFTTNIAGVKIGQQLQFLTALQEWMSPGGGFTILPSFNPPGVAIGYAIGAPQIPLGAVTFLNVALSITALLPFDTSPARFRFAFASAERPFGIIVAPYYFGGGFVALTSSASDALMYEIQFEFGAAAVVQFGPLRGYGQVSTGIYLRNEAGSFLLKGFVHALGEGQLGCFGISVNIEVALISDGHAMQGHATYTYSFKIGFAHFDFEFDAAYAFQGGGAEMLAAPGPALLGAAVPSPPYVLDYKDKQSDWLIYRDHFVQDWPSA
jgi:hypothetical protein